MAPSDGQSNDRDPPDGSSRQQQDQREQPDWTRGAIFIGLGVEFIGLVVGGLFLGHVIDESMGTTPTATLVCFVGSLVAVGFHIHRMLDLT